MLNIFKQLSIFLFFVFISCSNNNDIVNISIIHMNDTHGKDEEELIVSSDKTQTNYKYGAARRATYIKDFKSTNDNILILHAGDTITGSIYSTVFKGLDEVDIMNMIGVDVVTIGNHFVDYGKENFDELLKERKFPTISANILNKDNSLYTKAYITTNINGVNIAVIGLTTTDSVYNPDYIKDLVFVEEVESIKKLLSDTPLNKTNDITILLSHIGYDEDKRIASEFPNVFDIIVGGHSHTELFEPTFVKDTMIVQAGSYGRYLGNINFNVKNGKIDRRSLKYKLVEMDESIKQDEDMLKFIEEMKGTVDKEFNVRIATLPFDLEHDGIRSNSTALGNFACDLLLDSYDDIDIALINSGSLRTKLYGGDITLGNIQNEFFPFDNEVVILTLSGQDILDILSISAQKRGRGAFLQLSRGLEIGINNNHLVYAKLNGVDIDANKDYKVILSSFMYFGGDGYVNSNGEAIGLNAKKAIMTGNDIRDAMISKLKELNNVPLDFIDTKPRVIFE